MEEQIIVKLDVNKVAKWLRGDGEDDHVYERIAQAHYDYEQAQAQAIEKDDD